MTQYQQVIEALKKIGGKGTNKEICNEIDFKEWRAKNPENSVSRCLTTGKDFIKEGEFWLLKSNDDDDDNKKETLLYCSDGVLAVAIAKCSKNGWNIYGISEVHGFGDATYEKILFNMIFDEIIPFNSMSGVSFVAVKKAGLWGLIRFRLNPDFAYDKEFYRESIGTEPIDEKAMDPIGREIKMIENTEYSDINKIKNKYSLGLNDKFQNKFIPNKTSDKLKKTRMWSENLKEYTKETFANLEFGFSPEGTVRMKRDDGTFGYISLTDALNYKYNVHKDESDSVEYYKSVSEMIKAGWVLD